MTTVRRLTALAMVLVLCACAAVTTPRTPEQSVYAAYGAYTTVANTTADLTAAGTIAPGRAAEIRDRLAASRSVLDGARATVAAGNTPADDKLAAVRAVQRQLIQLQQQLQQEANDDGS